MPKSRSEAPSSSLPPGGGGLGRGGRPLRHQPGGTKLDPTTQKLVERLNQLDTCAVSDALDQLKLPGATIGIRPQWACPKIVGRAATVKIQPAGLTRPEAHLATPA